MKNEPTSPWRAFGRGVLAAALVGGAGGVLLAVVEILAGGPSIFSTRILPAVCCSLSVMVGLSQMGPWLLWFRSRSKSAAKVDDSLD